MKKLKISLLFFVTLLLLSSCSLFGRTELTNVNYLTYFTGKTYFYGNPIGRTTDPTSGVELYKEVCGGVEFWGASTDHEYINIFMKVRVAGEYDVIINNKVETKYFIEELVATPNITGRGNRTYCLNIQQKHGVTYARNVQRYSELTGIVSVNGYVQRKN